MGDFKTKNNFRGFAKLPVVLIERINIEPYLKIKARPPDKVMRPSPLLNDLSNKHVLKTCSVKICRDDLAQMKTLMYERPFVTCRICKKTYPDLKKLHNHQKFEHMIVYQSKVLKRVSFSDQVIVHELKEYHKCRKCSKIFDKYKFLKSHMRKDHKKSNCYVCYYCNKSFVDRSIFKVHIKLHCNVCKELFPTRAKYVAHRQNVCKVEKRYKCRTCKLSFFRYMDLRDHSYDHFSTFYICDICKHQLTTKCAVSHHIRYLHSEKRPKTLYKCRNLDTKSLYFCNFCEERSVEKETIETHVESLPDLSNRTMTGYKDFYFCDRCLRKFANEIELLQHKLTHLDKSEDSKMETSTSCEDLQSSEETETANNPNESNLSNEDVNIEDKDVNIEDKEDVNNEDVKDDEVIEDKKKTNASNQTLDAKNKVPEYMLPVVVLERINTQGKKVRKKTKNSVHIKSVDLDNMSNNEVGGLLDQTKGKPIVDPKTKKTLLSKHVCEYCNKYLSSGSNLKRHYKSVHPDILRCDHCEEAFVWPGLLQSHNCIRRLNPPEMEFDDARPEIILQNPGNYHQNNTLEEAETDDLEYPDFEIAAPIVELTEFDCSFVPGFYYGGNDGVKRKSDSVNGYKIVMQEIPVEF